MCSHRKHDMMFGRATKAMIISVMKLALDMESAEKIKDMYGGRI